jgi:cytochrome c biogenesis protein CcmG/thiol:disulfide interchange protein DsbE
MKPYLRPRYVLPLAIFAALLVFLGVGLRLKPQEVPSPFIGKPAPAFTLTRLEQEEGQEPRTFSPHDMLGKVWVFNVWASWCTSCRAEHPVLLAYAKQSATPVIGLNYMDARDEGRQWLDKFGNPYQLSVFDADGKVGTDYGVYGVPETFVIDKKGVVRLKLTGPVTPAVIKDTLQPLIEELNRA